MTDTSAYPGALDGDLKAIATAHVTAPPGAIDFLELLADAVAKIETELGTNPSGAAASVAAAIAALAPLASPAFTGTPTAPTAAGGTNSTQLATTAFVAAAQAALVDSSPAALDTLNELAAALGDDPNFATTVTNALAAKLDTATAATTYAPLDSPALIGTPTVPTQAAGDNSTKAASTAFIAGELGAYSQGDTVRKTANQTVNNNNSVFVADSELLAPLGAAETRIYRFTLYYSSTSVADIKFRLATPAGATGIVGIDAIHVAQNSPGTITRFATATLNQALAAGGSGANIAVAYIDATVSGGGTAGNVGLEWAQNTAEVSDTVVHAGSSVASLKA